MERERIKSIVHSLLFASEKPLSEDKIAEIIEDDLEKSTVEEIILEMKTDMENEVNSGTELERVAGGWQLRTKQDNTTWVKKLENIRPIRVSVSALEALAIIAYKQPVHKAEVDKIRGVDSSHLIRTLLEKNLIRISGRSELPGKPLLYSTTPEFLEVFGLANINELPSLKEMQDMDYGSHGETGDYKNELNESLRLVVEETSQIEISDSQDLEEVDQTLDEMNKIGKELRFDMDLVQEKVDIIFEEACRRYAKQRQEMFSEKEFQ